jgi:hypothetical protein
MRRFLTLIGLAFLVGCADLSPTDELSAAQGRWATWGPPSYDLTINPSCECLYRPVVVRVREGVIESRSYVADGQSVPFPEAALYPDVLGAFQLIVSKIQEGVLDRADYDPITGSPVMIRLDYDGPETNGVDGEVTYTLALRVR